VIGVLTDGRQWLIRTCGDDPSVVRGPPFPHTFDTAEGWLPLFEWVRDKVFARRMRTVNPISQIASAFSTMEDRLLP